MLTDNKNKKNDNSIESFAKTKIFQ